MRAVRSSTVTDGEGVSVTETPWTETPGQTPPVDRQTPVKTLPSRNFVYGL